MILVTEAGTVGTWSGSRSRRSTAVPRCDAESAGQAANTGIGYVIVNYVTGDRVVALTNAEKQARWRVRRAEEIASLKAEIADLRAQIAADPTIGKPRKRKSCAKKPASNVSRLGGALSRR